MIPAPMALACPPCRRCVVLLLLLPGCGESGRAPAFPTDTEQRLTDLFSIVLAHELNHVVDCCYIRARPTLRGRKEELIEAAGQDSLNYLRSMFDPGFFTTAPQEFFASIANQWFGDSMQTLRRTLAQGLDLLLGELHLGPHHESIRRNVAL